jgi:Zn finger protein HypA/HybF involved in hydrogenase expression
MNKNMEAYCVKCKAKREMKDAKEITMKGKGGKPRLAMKGTCPKCSTGMYRIMGLKK